MNIQTIAVIGAGVMGRQVAWACARYGLTVRLYDNEPEKALEAQRQIRIWLAEELPAGELEGTLSRLRVARNLDEAVAGVDLAFENVPELLELKQSVYAQIEPHLAPDALLGSNASSIPWTPLARGLARPDRFFLANFSSPRTGRLVEYMGGDVTTPRTRQAALAWIRAIRMVPVPIEKEIMGYAGNRIWRAIKKECLFLADRGYATPANIDRAFMLAQGTKIGPFALMDQVGLHSVLRVDEVKKQGVSKVTPFEGGNVAQFPVPLYSAPAGEAPPKK